MGPPVPKPIGPPAPRPVAPLVQVRPPATPLGPVPQVDDFLAWDALKKEATPQPGDASVPFNFWLTNTSTTEVLINHIQTSCGCTVAKMPEQPWRILPGTNVSIDVTMNIQGKAGTISKGVTVHTSVGVKSLSVVSHIPSPANQPPTMAGGDLERVRNMQMAMADRQVVFKNQECAKCHVEPAQNKMGHDLYVAACGICHDSTHRAAMVPDLKRLRHPTNEDYWRSWISFGKTNSMMPAFAKEHGGPLTDEQIVSLVKYLSETIPSHPQPAALTPQAPKPDHADHEHRSSGPASSLPAGQ